MAIPHLLSSCRDGVTVMTSKNSDPKAKKIARNLQHRGVPIEYTKKCVIKIDRFNDSEICTTIRPNVRDKVVLLVWDFTGDVNLRIRELETALGALKCSSVRRVILVAPYIPYTRQERPMKRQPISAKDFAKTLEKFDIISHLITFDLHAPQIAAFYDTIEVINVPGHVIFAPFFRKQFKKPIVKSKLSILATDVGGSKRARDCAEKTDPGLDISIIDKRRDKHGTKAMKIVGATTDVMIAYDDIGGTMGSLLGACDLAENEGAKETYGAVTHNVVCPKDDTTGEEKIAASGKTVFTLDTLPRGKKYYKKHPYIVRVPSEEFMAELFMELISVDGSVGELIERWAENDH